jgi:hypothetical protein
MRVLAWLNNEFERNASPATIDIFVEIGGALVEHILVRGAVPRSVCHYYR